jgi:hypothetical protein
MTGPRSAEDRIALWLEQESAGFLPDRVLDATFDRTRDSHQRGPSVWRLPSMSRPIPALIAVGAAAVIVLAAVALIAKPAPNQKVGASPITAGPYTSPLFAYTLDVPAGWEVAPAVKPWPAGQRIETDPASVDMFSIPGSPINASMAVAAQPAPQGTTSSTWLSKWEAIREDIGGRCFGSSVGWMTATVVGLPAWHVKWRCDSPTDERSNWDEYTFLSGGMGYVISGNPTMIDRLLESFRVPSAVPVATPTPIATSTWTAYTSAQYGFTIRIPPGWTERPASRAWSFAVDGRTFDPSSPARDSFLNQAQDVQVSVWSIPVEPGSGPSSEADLESWIEQYCQQTDEQPCTGIKDRATALCVERRDCHPGFLVPFKDDVLAFWPTVGDDASVTAVAVWRSDADPTVEPYGGAVNLLEAFLSTIDTGQSGPVYPAPLPSP